MSVSAGLSESSVTQLPQITISNNQLSVIEAERRMAWRSGKGMKTDAALPSP